MTLRSPPSTTPHPLIAGGLRPDAVHDACLGYSLIVLSVRATTTLFLADLSEHCVDVYMSHLAKVDDPRLLRVLTIVSLDACSLITVSAASLTIAATHVDVQNNFC